MTRRRLSLEGTSNLALLAVSIWCGYVLYSRPATPAQTGRPERPYLEAGDSLNLDGLRLDDASLTVLLFLQSTCQYCTDNVPFYVRLRSEIERRTGVQRPRLAVVTRDDHDVASSYLRTHDITVDQLITGARLPDKVWATPTVVLLSPSGVVRGVWAGRLDSSRQQEVKRY